MGFLKPRQNALLLKVQNALIHCGVARKGNATLAELVMATSVGHFTVGFKPMAMIAWTATSHADGVTTSCVGQAAPSGIVIARRWLPLPIVT